MLFGIAVLGLGLGCGQDPAPGRREATGTPSRTADARGVAVVDGVPILLDEVATTSSKLRIPPIEALKRLIGEQLLIGEAQRRGFDQAPGVSHVARQAAVQALLEEVVEPVAVSDDDVATAYEQKRDRFETPEKRESFHILFELERGAGEARDDAAMRLAQTALAELQDAADPRVVWERYRGLGKVGGFEIKAEDIPPASRADAYAPEFLEGLFSTPGPGLVATPVRTSFGWHAIFVTKIVPPHKTPLPEAHAVLRSELTESWRAKALEGLLREVSRSHSVERNEAAIDAITHTQDEGFGAAAP